eukprot:SAG11_NODE_20860_length_436_cov_34.608309_1_plen_24_part_01
MHQKLGRLSEPGLRVSRCLWHNTQ